MAVQSHIDCTAIVAWTLASVQATMAVQSHMCEIVAWTQQGEACCAVKLLCEIVAWTAAR